MAVGQRARGARAASHQGAGGHFEVKGKTESPGGGETKSHDSPGRKGRQEENPFYANEGSGIVLDVSRFFSRRKRRKREKRKSEEKWKMERPAHRVRRPGKRWRWRSVAILDASSLISWSPSVSRQVPEMDNKSHQQSSTVDKNQQVRSLAMFSLLNGQNRPTSVRVIIV